jgi:hypothetical protein
MTLDAAINLTRESPPSEPIPIIEELPIKKNKRQLIINESYEEIEFNHPIDMDAIKIENLDMDQHESFEEVNMDLIEQ